MIEGTTAERINKILAAHFGHNDPMVQSHTLKELGADSLDVIEIDMALEEEFALDPETLADEISETTTVADLVARVEKALAPKNLQGLSKESPSK